MLHVPILVTPTREPTVAGECGVRSSRRVILNVRKVRVLRDEELGIRVLQFSIEKPAVQRREEGFGDLSP